MSRMYSSQGNNRDTFAKNPSMSYLNRMELFDSQGSQIDFSQVNSQDIYSQQSDSPLRRPPFAYQRYVPQRNDPRGNFLHGKSESQSSQPSQQVVPDSNRGNKALVPSNNDTRNRGRDERDLLFIIANTVKESASKVAEAVSFMKTIVHDVKKEGAINIEAVLGTLEATQKSNCEQILDALKTSKTANVVYEKIKTEVADKDKEIAQKDCAIKCLETELGTQRLEQNETLVNKMKEIYTDHQSAYKIEMDKQTEQLLTEIGRHVSIYEEQCQFIKSKCLESTNGQHLLQSELDSLKTAFTTDIRDLKTRFDNHATTFNELHQKTMEKSYKTQTENISSLIEQKLKSFTKELSIKAEEERLKKTSDFDIAPIHEETSKHERAFKRNSAGDGRSTISVPNIASFSRQLVPARRKPDMYAQSAVNFAISQTKSSQDEKQKEQVWKVLPAMSVGKPPIYPTDMKDKSVFESSDIRQASSSVYDFNDDLSNRSRWENLSSENKFNFVFKKPSIQSAAQVHQPVAPVGNYSSSMDAHHDRMLYRWNGISPKPLQSWTVGSKPSPVATIRPQIRKDLIEDKYRTTKITESFFDQENSPPPQRQKRCRGRKTTTTRQPASKRGRRNAKAQITPTIQPSNVERDQDKTLSYDKQDTMDDRNTKPYDLRRNPNSFLAQQNNLVSTIQKKSEEYNSYDSMNVVNKSTNDIIDITGAMDDDDSSNESSPCISVNNLMKQKRVDRDMLTVQKVLTEQTSYTPSKRAIPPLHTPLSRRVRSSAYAAINVTHTDNSTYFIIN